MALRPPGDHAVDHVVAEAIPATVSLRVDSATRNRITQHLRNVDRTRTYAPVDGILAGGRKAAGLAEA
jgi:hypothetical protein